MLSDNDFHLHGKQHVPAPYDTPVQGGWTSVTGVSARPHEAQVNSSLAALGRSSNPYLRRAIVAAIVPTTDVDEWPTDELWIKERGDDADWLIFDHLENGQVVAACEHKPMHAPAQWSRASTAAFYDERAGQAIRNLANYQSTLNPYRHVLDQKTFTTNDLAAIEAPDPVYYFSKRSKNRGHEHGHLQHVIPQVLNYWHRHHVTIHILNDKHCSASELYKATGDPYGLQDALFPIHTTADTLNVIATRLKGVRLTSDEAQALTRVLDAMWIRGPERIDHSLDDEARRLISPAARWVGYHMDDVEWR
ncbi:hypothetical protein FK529_03060 [Tsukamurella asaccharolytica]|uniref:Uncharacterized protein n=1 Tax=Tsukamurella asaccharolytica TaxID=2592067 RepID=A0A5C5REL9_9ACTN|nr:hypothetical protein [Tsukamurella asaccharolytica]TWS21579.1 hypothetical protein FK529_03060 [Tsukamurella asaccharolytica]